MLTATPRNSGRHVLLLVVLGASVIVLFALLLHLVMGLATAPISGQVTGSFGAGQTADYGRSPARAVAPQRSR